MISEKRPIRVKQPVNSYALLDLEQMRKRVKLSVFTPAQVSSILKSIISWSIKSYLNT